jgi:hypothetical protein
MFDSRNIGFLMSRKKRRYYETYEAIKGCQHVTNLKSRAVTDWELQDLFLDRRDNMVNRRQRSRIGHVERKKKR